MQFPPDESLRGTIEIKARAIFLSVLQPDAVSYQFPTEKAKCSTWLHSGSISHWKLGARGQQRRGCVAVGQVGTKSPRGTFEIGRLPVCEPKPKTQKKKWIRNKIGHTDQWHDCAEWPESFRCGPRRRRCRCSLVTCRTSSYCDSRFHVRIRFKYVSISVLDSPSGWITALLKWLFFQMGRLFSCADGCFPAEGRGPPNNWMESIVDLIDHWLNKLDVEKLLQEWKRLRLETTLSNVVIEKALIFFENHNLKNTIFSYGLGTLLEIPKKKSSRL